MIKFHKSIIFVGILIVAVSSLILLRRKDYFVDNTATKYAGIVINKSELKKSVDSFKNQITNQFTDSNELMKYVNNLFDSLKNMQVAIFKDSTTNTLMDSQPDPLENMDPYFKIINLCSYFEKVINTVNFSIVDVATKKVVVDYTQLGVIVDTIQSWFINRFTTNLPRQLSSLVNSISYSVDNTPSSSLYLIFNNPIVGIPYLGYSLQANIKLNAVGTYQDTIYNRTITKYDYVDMNGQVILSYNDSLQLLQNQSNGTPFSMIASDLYDNKNKKILNIQEFQTNLTSFSQILPIFSGSLVPFFPFIKPIAVPALTTSSQSLRTPLVTNPVQPPIPPIEPPVVNPVEPPVVNPVEPPVVNPVEPPVVNPVQPVITTPPFIEPSTTPQNDVAQQALPSPSSNATTSVAPYQPPEPLPKKKPCCRKIPSCCKCQQAKPLPAPSPPPQPVVSPPPPSQPIALPPLPVKNNTLIPETILGLSIASSIILTAVYFVKQSA